MRLISIFSSNSRCVFPNLWTVPFNQTPQQHLWKLIVDLVAFSGVLASSNQGSLYLQTTCMSVWVCVCDLLSACVTEWVSVCQQLTIPDDTCHLQLSLKAPPCHELDRFSQPALVRCKKEPSKTPPRNSSVKKTIDLFLLWEWTTSKPSSFPKKQRNIIENQLARKKTHNKQGTQWFKCSAYHWHIQ